MLVCTVTKSWNVILGKITIGIFPFLRSKMYLIMSGCINKNVTYNNENNNTSIIKDYFIFQVSVDWSFPGLYNGIIKLSMKTFTVKKLKIYVFIFCLNVKHYNKIKAFFIFIIYFWVKRLLQHWTWVLILDRKFESDHQILRILELYHTSNVLLSFDKNLWRHFDMLL